jgi:IS5 family transposase
MLQSPPQTPVLFTTSEEVILEKMIRSDHAFRKLNDLLDFDALASPLRSLYSDVGAVGLDVKKGMKCLLIQFWEDYSDREMEKALEENVALKWFCGFSLLEETPDHSYFGKLRKRLGTKPIADLFHTVNEVMENRGLVGNIFTFIDASALVTKTALWEERDRAILEGEEKLTNTNVSREAADPDARFGAKSSKKIWFGYKRHHAVDMRHGLITKVAVTPANVPDAKAMKHVCPKQGMVFMDKGYVGKEVAQELKRNQCADGTIQRDNMKTKNRDLDRYRTRTRMPFEGNFSKLRRRTKYRTTVKVLFQCFGEALCHNLKKAIRILPPPIPIYP